MPFERQQTRDLQTASKW